jgi:hypothetical protein
MIDLIGILIAAYVITRMADLLGQPRDRVNLVAKILAVITIVIALIVPALLISFDLAIQQHSAPPPQLPR